MNKKGLSFGSIVAIIGSILIALGVAWLIAQNWHQMPSPIKIIILLLATTGTYFAGTMLRINKYPGIGKALLVLGALLYTLSIFLIAQIFSTDATIQGTAWLLLIAWIGVFILSYIFQSSISLVVALIEFLVWIVIQFIAYSEAAKDLLSPGILAFYFLIVGILLYGLCLWHRAKKHDFAGLYQWWTVFYFLAFTYLLSFQLFLPMLWPKEAVVTTAPIILLFVLAISSIIVISSGVVLAINNNSAQRKELLGMMAIVIVLIALISLTALTSDKLGLCSEKRCFDNDNQEECESASEEKMCLWDDNRCDELSCWDLKEPSECETDERISCEWHEGRCEQIRCFDKKDKELCLSEQSCMWSERGCVKENCWAYISQDECEESKLSCKWERSSCREYDLCSDYNNKFEACKGEKECKWRTNDFNFGNDDVPIIVWTIWIIINIALIMIILTFIAYGTWLKLPKIINLAIIFFALDIVTRYIGFMMDLWGYTSLSIIFITGGSILLIGGWLIEKWRRKLIERTKQNTKG